MNVKCSVSWMKITWRIWLKRFRQRIIAWWRRFSRVIRIKFSSFSFAFNLRHSLAVLVLCFLGDSLEESQLSRIFQLSLQKDFPFEPGKLFRRLDILFFWDSWELVVLVLTLFWKESFRRGRNSVSSGKSSINAWISSGLSVLTKMCFDLFPLVLGFSWQMQGSGFSRGGFLMWLKVMPSAYSLSILVSSIILLVGL